MSANSRTLLLSGALAALLSPSAQAANVVVDLGQTGEGVAFDVSQPSLGLTALVTTQGSFDQLGEIWWFAGNFAPRGTQKAEGQLLSISTNSALFSKVGPTYGGDGISTFALPDLRGRTPVGAASEPSVGEQTGESSVALGPRNLPEHTHDTDTGPSDPTGQASPDSFELRQPSLSVNYQLASVGVFPSRSANAPEGPSESAGPAESFLGAVSMHARGAPSFGTVDADGALLSIGDNSALFSILGTTYGGDGRTTFGVPDLVGRAAVGVGSAPGLEPRSLGRERGSDTATLTDRTMPSHTHTDPDGGLPSFEGASVPIDLLQPELALNYVISLTGIFPSRAANTPLFPDGPVEALGISPFIGEIGLFAGNFAPRGWAFAHGQLLPINTNEALFSLLGATYGGDGRTTFALPDLRGRVPVGAGAGPGLAPVALGQEFGRDTRGLFNGNLPPHGHTIERTAPIPLPAGAWLLLGGLGGLIALRRRT